MNSGAKKAYDHARYLNTRAARNAASRSYYVKNADSIRAKNKEWKARNPERVLTYRRRKTLRKYGLTMDQWEVMFHTQGNGCAICKSISPGGKGQWHTDHCHHSGRVRGILCHSCNTSLGHMQDDPLRLRLAADYLERN